MADETETAEPSRPLFRIASGERVSVPQADVYARLGEVDARGQPMWRTDNDQTVVLYRDERTGDLLRRIATDAEIRHRNRFSTQSNIELVRDPRSEEANASELRRGRRQIAAESPLTAFAQGAGNVASLGFVSVAEEFIAGEDISEHIELLEQQNPLATPLGELFGVGATLVGPGALMGGRVGARGMLGFSERVGARVTRGLGGGSMARVAGRGARATALDVPISLQFQAADLADSNQPFSGEAMAAQTGTDVLWGLAFEAALPVVGTAVRRFRTPTGMVSDIARRAFGSGSAVRRGVSTASGVVAMGRRGQRVARAAAENAADLSRFDARSLSRMADEEADALVRRVAAAEEARGTGPTEDWVRLADNPQSARTASTRIRTAATAASRGLESIARPLLDREGVLATASEAFRQTPINYGGASADAAARADGMLFTLGAELHGAGAPRRVTNPIAEARTAVQGANPEAAAEILHRLRTELVDTGARTVGDPDIAVAASRGSERIAELLGDGVAFGEEAALSHRALSGLVDDVIGIRAGALGDLSTGTRAQIRKRLDEGMLASFGEEGSVPRRLQEGLDGAEAAIARAEAAGVAVPSGVRKGIEGTRSALAEAGDAIAVAEAMNRVREGQRLGGTLGRSLGLITAAGEITPEGIKMAQYRANLAFLDGVSSAREALATFIATGIPPGVPSIGILAFRDFPPDRKREAFREISEGIQSTVFDPESMVDALAPSIEEVSAVDPELADNIGRAATLQLVYLAENLPQAPTNILGEPAYELPLTDIDVFLERFGAIQAPESLVWALAEGTVTPEASEAVRIVYPELYVEMQIQIAEEFAAAAERGQDDVPYVTKVAASAILGSGIDPTLANDFILEMQRTDSQTQEQEQALRGPRQSERKPTFAQNSLTVTTRLENL